MLATLVIVCQTNEETMRMMFRSNSAVTSVVRRSSDLSSAPQSEHPMVTVGFVPMALLSSPSAVFRGHAVLCS